MKLFPTSFIMVCVATLLVGCGGADSAPKVSSPAVTPAAKEETPSPAAAQIRANVVADRNFVWPEIIQPTQRETPKTEPKALINSGGGGPGTKGNRRGPRRGTRRQKRRRVQPGGAPGENT